MRFTCGKKTQHLAQTAFFGLLHAAPARNDVGDLRESFRRGRFGVRFADHAATIGSIAEKLTVIGMMAMGSISSGSRKSAGAISGRLGMPTRLRMRCGACHWGAASSAHPSGSWRCAVGKVRHRRDHNLIGFGKHATRPIRPSVRNIQNRDRRTALQHFDDRLEGAPFEIIGPVEQRGCSQQGEMLGAFGQKTVEKNLVQPLGRIDRLSNALRRILIEIDIGGAIGQIQIRQMVSSQTARNPNAQLWQW